MDTDMEEIEELYRTGLLTREEYLKIIEIEE